MTKKARIAVLIFILIQLAAMGVLRQMNQVLFIKVQDTGLQYRLAQQSLNRAHIDFLNAKRSLPKLAKQQGFVERGYQNDL